MQCSIVVVLAIGAALLHGSKAEINSSFVIEIIKRLESVYNFETVPIFSGYLNEPKNSQLWDFSRNLAEQCAVPQINLYTLSRNKLKRIIDLDVLSVVLLDEMQRDVLEIMSTVLGGMRLSKIMLVFRYPLLVEKIEFFKSWLWEKQFVHVLILFEHAATHQNQIFSIDPYPKLKWVNQTLTFDPKKLYAGNSKDLKQYLIKVPYMQDTPRVFPYTRNGQNQMVGRHGMLIKLFAKTMNINLVCNYEPNTDLKKILTEFRNKTKDLCLHSYAMFDLEGVGLSYPLETVRWCIMVPLRSEVPKSEYVIIAFDWATWLVSCIAVFYIGLLMRFVSPHIGNAPKRHFLRSMAMLTYSPNMAERMISPTIRQFVFYGLVFLLGFILSCIYSTYLTSFCTNMVFQPPIDTVDDLVKENLRVMVIDYELERIRERQTYGNTFLKLLYPVSYFQVVKHRNTFDSRYAYSIRQDRWNYLDKQQRGLEKPLFRLSNICFGRHYTMFPLQNDSHLRPHLDNFILLVMQAGLDLFWDEQAFRMAVSMKHSKVLVEQTVVIQQLRVDYFKHVWVGWTVGMALSTMCFACELLWKKFKDMRAMAFLTELNNSV